MVPARSRSALGRSRAAVHAPSVSTGYAASAPRVEAPTTGGAPDGAGRRLPAIEADDLSKRYGDVTAVERASFRVERGEVFALLGPNGAGKTTTINMLCTLARPTAGTARIDGFDVRRQPRHVRRHIGMVFQEPTLDDQLTAEENLRFHAVLYHVPRHDVDRRIGAVLELVDLSPRRRDLVSTFSGGMARRLEIARGMLHTPAVLFLDEPTIGLDPQTRALMWEDILRLRREQSVTILLTTHYMDEAEYADRIAIIDHGVIVALDTPDALKARVGADTVTLVSPEAATARRRLEGAGFAVRADQDTVVVFTEDGESKVARLLEVAAVPVSNVHVHRPTLDDVFLHFTGRQIREAPGDRATSMRLRAMARRR